MSPDTGQPVARKERQRLRWASSPPSGKRSQAAWTHDAVEAWEDGEPLAIAGKEQSYRDFAMARVYFPFLRYRLGKR